MIDPREARGGPGVVCFPRTLAAFSAGAPSHTLPPPALLGVSLALEAPAEDLDFTQNGPPRPAVPPLILHRGNGAVGISCLPFCVLGLRKAETKLYPGERGGKGAGRTRTRVSVINVLLLTLRPIHQCCVHVVTWVGGGYVFLLSRRAGSRVAGNPSSQGSTAKKWPAENYH